MPPVSSLAPTSSDITWSFVRWFLAEHTRSTKNPTLLTSEAAGRANPELVVDLICADPNASMISDAQLKTNVIQPGGVGSEIFETKMCPQMCNMLDDRLRVSFCSITPFKKEIMSRHRSMLVFNHD